MKKYYVFQMLSEPWSPNLKYSTNDENDARQMCELLKKEDYKHKYVVMQIVDSCQTTN